eukprot:TRINITY_DN2167_c2_g1_i1.p1 TRINITY_DN2167_c2_g1~~TRINITY_DN2167_c2_g1_i1.p1  ORF type:complete len:225 (-),score=74.12 TRINITY_DN2167_c2_g1_i1:32-706(-)
MNNNSNNKSLTSFDLLRNDRDVRNHVRTVYLNLAATLFFATAGVFTYSFFPIPFALVIIFLFGSLFTIWFTSPERISIRETALLGFSFSEGMALTPQLAYTSYTVGSNVIITALGYTASMFIAFSIAAMLSPRGTYFSLLPFLFFGASSLFIFSLIGVESAIIVLGGIILFAGYILYDTQKIIERANLGNRDFVSDTLELFLDFINLFIRILKFLSSKEKKRNK